MTRILYSYPVVYQIWWTVCKHSVYKYLTYKNEGYILVFMYEYTEHNNVDSDVIKINKDSLILRLYRCKDYYASSNSAFGFGGNAIALLLAGYLTETFKNIGPIPGETIRGTFIVLGIVCLVLTLRAVIAWIQTKGEHEPKKIVESLLKKPISIPISKSILSTFTRKNQNKKNHSMDGRFFLF